jgi:hypothetical protein
MERVALVDVSVREVRINVTMSPHVQKGRPSGYYVLAERLFPRGAPILVKQQYVGYSEGLVITVAHPAGVKSVLSMAVNVPRLGDKPVTWLAEAHLYPMRLGFRAYVAGRVLKARSTETPRYMTTGLFRGEGELYWLWIPAVSGDVLLGRKELVK